MKNDSEKELWVDKYRPGTLDEYVLNPDIKEYFRNMKARGILQNFTTEGPAGMGKTTLARLLAKEFDAEVLFVKCATEGTIDVLRSKIEPFCNALSFEGRLKIVILDEIDAASGTTGNGSGFQSGLRTLIEAAQDDCRFLLTCNYVGKVIPAVLSRCPVVPLKYDKKDLLVHVKKILDAEKIKYEKESLKAFIEEAFGFYPDCRRIINYLQMCSASGKLTVKLGKTADSGKKEFFVELIEKTKTCSDVLELRRFCLANKDKTPDLTATGSELFSAAADGGFLDADGILEMSDLLYKLNVVVDKEVGFFAMVVALWKRIRSK